MENHFRMKKPLLLLLALTALSACDRRCNCWEGDSTALGINHHSRDMLEKTNQKLFQSVLALDDSLIASTLPESREPLDIIQITTRMTQAWAIFLIPATQIDN